MLHTRAAEIVSKLDPKARVLDVGGGIAPLGRADYVLDFLTYDQYASHYKAVGEGPERFNRTRWIQFDICDRRRWPFDDGFFDYVVCSHVLEDVRDPIWVCAEIARVARAGYIETPSRIVEQSKGVEHPCYAGYYHHRWLVSAERGCVVFRFKPHSLHALASAIVARVGPFRKINPVYENFCFEWKDRLDFREQLEFSEAKVNEELAAFAAKARETPDLTVPTHIVPLTKLKYFVYFLRLRLGLR